MRLGGSVFLVALSLRLIHVWAIRHSPFFDILMGDARAYDEWAQRIAGGDWIGTEVFYQAPLYPYFLGTLYSIFGRDLLIVRIVQAIIGSGSCALLYLAGARLWSRNVGLIAGLGLALWAPAIFFDGILQKSVLDMFFVCLSIWLVSRIVSAGAKAPALQWLMLGVALGLLAITRENALVFIVVIVVWMFLGTQGTVRTLSTFALGLAIVLLPVASRNYAVGGGFYLTTSQFGTNFYIGNNPKADGTYASLRFGRGSPEFERQDAIDLAQAAMQRTLTPSEVSAYWTDQATSFITSQPAAWLRLMARKARLLVNRSEMFDTESQESYADVSWPLGVLGPITHFGVLIPLALLGVITSWRDRRRLWVIGVMAAAYGASVVIFYVFARYRFPLVPFLLLFAAAGVVACSGWWRTSSTAERSAAAALIVVAILFTNQPALSADLMRAITENNLGTALQEAKRPADAIEHHRRAIALMPDYPPAHNNLGTALHATGRLDEAIAEYQKAIALLPDFADARFNLANVQLEKGNTGASIAGFESALQAQPGSVQAQNNLGIALAKSGDTAGAMAAFGRALALDETSVQAHRNLGNMLFDAGRREEGLAHLERAAALSPGEGDAAFDIGTIMLGDGNYSAAADRFKSVIAVRPKWVQAHNNLGIALASMGRLDEAIAEFRAALAIDPAFNQAQDNLKHALAIRK